MINEIIGINDKLLNVKIQNYDDIVASINFGVRYELTGRLYVKTNFSLMPIAIRRALKWEYRL